MGQSARDVVDGISARLAAEVAIGVGDLVVERDRYRDALRIIARGVDDNDLVLGTRLLRGVARDALEGSWWGLAAVES